MAKIYLYMLKKWGHSEIGQTVAFDESKGRRVIAGGFAKEVPPPEHKAEKRPKAETAMINPESEKAVVTPDISGKNEPPACSAEDEAEAKKDTKEKARARGKGGKKGG